MSRACFYIVMATHIGMHSMPLAMLLLLATVTPTSASGALSPQTRALIAPVHAAYAQVEAEQSLLPPPKNTSDRLERLLDRDQAGRKNLSKVDLASLPKAERAAASAALWSEINAHDLADQEELKKLIPADGWFKRSIYGDKAITAAFLIVQHAVNDQPLMRRTLSKLDEYVPLGEAKGEMYALMFDRIALEFDHKPQRYGSQLTCVAGHWTPTNLEDPAHVDERRKAVGLSMTEADYIKGVSDSPCS